MKPLRPGSQRTCYDALSLALQEGYVFAALTGPAAAGKTTVLEAVIGNLSERAMRWIRITHPDQVQAQLAAQIEKVAYAEAGKPENADRHVVLAIDDAHTSSQELLRCLTRIAGMREPGRRVPQVLLVGRTELWSRLAAEEFQPLARRIAVRAMLQPAEPEVDPWASVEQELTHALTEVRPERPFDRAAMRPPPQMDGPVPDAAHTRGQGSRVAQHFPPSAAEPMAREAVPPPSLYALFPDAPPRAEPERKSRRRLLLPLGSLLLVVAACVFVLSFYDWPDLLGDLPWGETKPATPAVIPSAPPSSTPSPSAVQLAPVQTLPTPKPVEIEPKEASAPATLPSEPRSPAPVLAPAETIAPPPEPAKPAPTVTAQPSPPAPVAPVPSEASEARPAVPLEARPAPVATAAAVGPEIIALLLRRGDEQLSIGDVSAARLLYQRAAEAGSAQGARRAARTYDKAFLPAAEANTLADRAAARVWYERAAALGDDEAARRLKSLGEEQ